MRLATKIIASTLLVIVLLTGVAGYFSVRSKFQEFDLAQRRLAQATATAIQKELTLAWQNEGLSGVVRFLENASSASKGALQIRWVWLDDQALPQERPHVTLDEESIPFGETFSLVALDVAGQRSLYTYVPIPLASNRPGALEFAESLAPLERLMWRDGLLTLCFIGSLALVSIATAYLTGINWVARPLEKLISKTERIGHGDFTEPLELPSRDELGQLAVAINDMCARLERQKDELARESEQRIAMLGQLRHADRLKTVGRLAAGLGHELGTPLNVISGRAGLIGAGKLTDLQIQESARVIKDEADRVTEIVRQLLDFARPRPPRRTAMDMMPVIERTIELLQPIADRNSVRLHFSHPSAEASDSNGLVQADAAQLQQVFTNIIVNAIQSMPHGGDVKIALETVQAKPQSVSADESTKAYWKVSVTDQGVGIAPEHREHVFEPFFTTKDVNEGTGLGLSIAFGIVQEHMGWIDVASELGRGSRFDVYLPRGVN